MSGKSSGIFDNKGHVETSDHSRKRGSRSWHFLRVSKKLALVFAVVSGIGAWRYQEEERFRIAGVVSIVVFLLLWLEGVSKHARNQRLLAKARLKSLAATCVRQASELEPDAFRKEMDILIKSFECFARVLTAAEREGAAKRKIAEIEMNILRDILEHEGVNSVFRTGNWNWACSWERGSVSRAEAAERFCVVFPTIIAAANVKSHAPRGPSTQKLEHIAAWCTDLLEQPVVREFVATARSADIATTSEDTDGPPGTRSPITRRAVPSSSWSIESLSAWVDWTKTGCFGRLSVRQERDRTISASRSAKPKQTLKQLEAVDADGRRDFVRRSHPEQTHCWEPCDATVVLVRGATYLEDSCKELSKPAMLELVDCHLFETNTKVMHYSASTCLTNVVRKARKAGDQRFFFIMNWLIDPHQMVVLFAVPEDADWRSTKLADLFERFCSTTDDERNERLKLIPRVVQGPWVVKQALPEIPSLIGQKIPISYFKGDGYLEASINVCHSSVGRRLLGLMQGASKYFGVEIFVVIEGQQPEELPERVLLSICCDRGHLDKVKQLV